MTHSVTAIADHSSFTTGAIKLAVVVVSLLTIGLSILSRPDWKLRDFDQVFYVTIAYDLDRYGVFSDGIFDPVDSSVRPAQPGMFFGPVFPAMILAVMKIDPRFAEAVRCSVDSNRGHRDESVCEAYETPIRILGAVLLALGVVAIGFIAALIFRQTRWIFPVAGLLATAALAGEAHIFSFVMTESTQFAFYGVFAWAFLSALVLRSIVRFVIAGALLGVLALTKPSFVALFPIALTILLYFSYKITKLPRNLIVFHSLVFTAAFVCVIGPWMARNYVSVGKFGLTKE